MNGQTALAGVSIRWGAATDVGRTRTVNEDSTLANPPVFLVADGMGGHAAGDVASRMVVDEFGQVGTAAPPLAEVDRVLRQVNHAIIDAGKRTDPPTSMGSTAVGLILVDNGGTTSWLIVNVGDSRAYVLTTEGLDQLSTDHSYVQELVEAGAISASDARRHPERNVVTRAVGVDAHLDPDYWLRRPVEGERFLLCSDGLSGEVDDGTIGEVLRSEPDPVVAANSLVRLALDAGGRDNVSVLVVDVVAVDATVGDPVTDTAPSGIPKVDVERPKRPERRTAGSPRGGRRRAGRPNAPSAPGLIDSVPSLEEIAESDVAVPRSDPGPGAAAPESIDEVEGDG